VKLTKEEKELIVERRKQAEAKEQEKAVYASKIGYLKEKLYTIHVDKYEIEERWLYTEVEKDNFLQRCVRLICEPGDVFDCYIDNGKENWYDRKYGLEGLSVEWAKEHLINIQDVKLSK
jgi:hypothetical protein